MKTKNMMFALALLTTGTIWAEDSPKDSLKVVDIEEVVVIATPKENRKLRDLPVAPPFYRKRTCVPTRSTP